MATKKHLREFYLAKRKEMHPDALERLSGQIAEKFFSLKLDHVKFLHIYYPIVGKHEINALLIAEEVRKNYPGIHLVLSKSDLKDCSLKHIVWEESTALTMNAWGVTEPLSGEPVSPGQLDIIVLPLLAYDKEGNRLGYGKGFYDRFLKECRADALKIGISLFPPEEELLEHQSHDVPLDMCITPKKVWQFKPGAPLTRGNDPNA